MESTDLLRINHKRMRRRKNVVRLKFIYLVVVVVGLWWFFIQTYFKPEIYIFSGVILVQAEEIAVDVISDTIKATITAYTSSVDETDDTPFITASGVRTRRGIIACPSKYKFGTQIVIEGRQFICEDRMNPRYWDENRFDVWVETKHEAFNWGVRELEVLVLR